MMSKGNINYRYLRRRKSWFRRNLDIIIVYGIIAVVIIALIVAAIVLYNMGMLPFFS